MPLLTLVARRYGASAKEPRMWPNAPGLLSSVAGRLVRLREPKPAGMADAELGAMSLLAVLRIARADIIRVVVSELLSREANTTRSAQSTIIDDLPRLLSELEEALERDTGRTGTATGTALPRPHQMPVFTHGFQLSWVIREYGALRRAIFDQLTKHDASGLSAAESNIVADVIDSRIGAAVEQYMRASRQEAEIMALERGNTAAGCSPPQSQTGEKQPLFGVSVLVVDDDPDALELGSMVLRRAGADVQEACGAQRALQLLKQGPVHVLVSDIGMPDLDGYELMQRVRMREETADIRAVAVTAFVRQEDRERALRAGFDDHLAKPTAPDVLVDTVARLANLA